MKPENIINSDGDINFIEENFDDSDLDNVTISLTFYLALSAEKLGMLKSSLKVGDKIEIEQKESSNKTIKKKQDKYNERSTSIASNLALTGFKASCEYILAPFNKDPTKLELFMDCDVSKIHVAGKDVKTTNNWCENSLIWTAWTNNHTMTSMEDNFEVFNDDINITLTTNPDKITGKFKTEKSKTDISSGIEEAEPKIEQLFETIRKIYGKSGLEEITEQHQLQKVIACSMEAQENIIKLKDKLLSEVNRSIKSEIHVIPREDENSKKKKTKVGNVKSSKKDKNVPEAEKYTKIIEERHETYVARINLAKFIVGSRNQIMFGEFLPQGLNSSPWIERAFVRVELRSGSLIPEDQLHQLNPMLITIKSAQDLPPMPSDFYNFKMRCEPSYVTHCFLDEERFRHKSHSKPQSRKTVWDDNYVIFLGKIDSSILKGFFFGPGLLIEVHDRDLITNDNEGTLFGHDDDDELFNCTSYVSYKTFTNKMNAWNAGNISQYHGRALCNLSDLLISQTSIVTTLNITNSPIPTNLKKQESIIQNYISAGSQLNVQVTLCRAFVPAVILDSKMRFYNSLESPFVRVILKFSHSNKTFLRSLIEMITKLNIYALDVGCLGFLDQQILLSTYKLSEEKCNDPCYDIITGFHVCDNSIHIVVLEGIAYGLLTNSIYHLMNCLADEENDSQESSTSRSKSASLLIKSYECPGRELDDKVQFMHHTNMTFRKRLYSGLNLNLQTIQMQDSIENIVKQPLIHLRNLLPYPCYSCIMKLHQIEQTSTITSITRNDAFPTFEELSAMTKLLSNGCGCCNHLEIIREKTQEVQEDGNDFENVACGLV